MRVYGSLDKHEYMSVYRRLRSIVRVYRSLWGLWENVGAYGNL